MPRAGQILLAVMLEIFFEAVKLGRCLSTVGCGGIHRTRVPASPAIHENNFRIINNRKVVIDHPTALDKMFSTALRADASCPTSRTQFVAGF